jgi:uncharacterized protein (TIGR04255 family)
MPAPIVELIAELRWQHGTVGADVGQAPALPGMILSAPHVSAGLEEFFMRFGAAAAQFNHRNIERLVPPGFPLILHQPVYRFRPDQGQGPVSSIYQCGPGLFTANAVPPYESWKTFEPIVRDGVNALLGARPASESELPFSGITLRYIDVFDQTFIQGRDLPAFLSEVMGLSIGLPAALSEHIAPGAAYKPVLQLNIPMADQSVLGMVFGEGAAGGRHGFVMETSLSTAQHLPPSADAVMKAFNSFRDVIHKAFVGLTKPLRELMPPEARE